jgi:tryptophanyl-tRNA synthetase
MQLNPWETIDIKDYDELFEKFGLERIKLIPELKKNVLFRRGIVFAHRDLDKFMAALAKKEKTSILTGLMPSGPMHLGHKMVVDQCVFWQDLGVKTRVLVADIEARLTRGLSREDAQRIAVDEYLVNWIALGLDPKKSDIYAQSNRSIPYYDLAATFSGRITLAEMNAIYGDLSPGKITSSLIQSSDIIHGQLPEYDGPHHVLVPVGVDQDPHMRMTRGLAEKEGFIKPSSTYHRFMTGLDGGKMSSSRPASFIALNDPPEVAVKKAGAVLTGGRNTVEEQRKLGGQPDKCVVFELETYHFMPDDKELADLRRKCEKGEIMCGECKQILKERMRKFFVDLGKKREKARKTVEKLSIFR